MLEGGRDPEGTFVPLDDSQLRKEIMGVRGKLATFREFTRQRLESRKVSGPGTKIDQEHDMVFKDFMDQADRVETRLQEIIRQELAAFRNTMITLIVACLSMAGLIGIILHRHER